MPRPFRPPAPRVRLLRRVAVTGAAGALGYETGKRKGLQLQPEGRETADSGRQQDEILASQSRIPVDQHAAQPQAQAGAEAAYVPSADDRLAQLEKLGRLRDSGVLTEEEFKREKDRILET